MDSHPHAPLPPSAAAPQLRCVLLCDLVNSTRLVEVLGDIRAAELIREHDRLARELVQRHLGQEIDKTDGLLLLFERPIEAVRCALDYQRGLHALGDRLGQPLRARVGVHVGEVLSWRTMRRRWPRGPSQIVTSQEIPQGWTGLDIGPATVRLFSEALQDAKTIIWNGPMGMFEKDAYSRGTFAIARAVADSYATTIVGGGDTDVAVHNAGVSDSITFISTGGGASLELLEGKDLPGLAALTDDKE